MSATRRSMDRPPRLGQSVTVDVDGTLIEGVFYSRVQEHDLALEDVPEGGVRVRGGGGAPTYGTGRP